MSKSYRTVKTVSSSLLSIKGLVTYLVYAIHMLNFKYLKNDLPSSLVVFLVALPLCLGIALASEAPLMSGLIAGIVGGLVVALLSGSELSVSGPAAGLAVIVSAGISDVGSFQAFCLAVMLAGIFQILFSILKMGSFGQLFPVSVIEGMLAAIGFIIILKQIPHGLGKQVNFQDELHFLSFLPTDSALTEVLKWTVNLNLIAVAVCVGGITTMVIWDKIISKKTGMITRVPGALLGVVLGVVINEAAKIWWPEIALSSDRGQLVAIPIADPNAGSVFSQFFSLPDFSALGNAEVWKVGITIAIVASIESLLSIQAADKIDPEKRISSTNKELFAQGAGNVLSGLLGGIPLTSVIVRTSANVYSGAKTRLSGFLHGGWLVLALFVFAALLNKIPLAALAAVLIRVGYKLSSITVFKKMNAKGQNVFIPFVVTFVGVITTDLLVGVMIGFIVSLVIVLRTNYVSAVSMVHEDQDYFVQFTKDVSFINRIRLKDVLMEIPDHARVMISGSQARFIDHDIYEVIEEFKETAKHKHIKVELQNIEGKHYPTGLFKSSKKQK